MLQDELPIICGGTHYFVQHFLFPPSDMSFDRPAEEVIEKKSATQGDSVEIMLNESTISHQRWSPPSSRPKVPDDMDPGLLKLLETFYTSDPVYPNSEGVEESEAGPSNYKTTRLVPTDPGQLLSLHKLLATIDPREAGRWDWRDGRKVRRGIERWWERNEAIEVDLNESMEPSGSRKAR